MTEKEFLDKIDCNFPYNNKEQSLALINDSFNISVLCVYKVLEEIVRVPYGVEIDKNLLKIYLDYIFNKYNDEIINIIKNTCYSMIKGIDISTEEAILLMEELKQYKYCYSPLNIIYLSCDDINGIVEDKYQYIIRQWN